MKKVENMALVYFLFLKTWKSGIQYLIVMLLCGTLSACSNDWTTVSGTNAKNIANPLGSIPSHQTPPGASNDQVFVSSGPSAVVTGSQASGFIALNRNRRIVGGQQVYGQVQLHNITH